MSMPLDDEMAVHPSSLLLGSPGRVKPRGCPKCCIADAMFNQVEFAREYAAAECQSARERLFGTEPSSQDVSCFRHEELHTLHTST